MRTLLSRIRNSFFDLFDLKERNLCRRHAVYDIMHGFNRIYFYHIRKTGGTSLIHMFLSLGGESREDVYRRLNKKPNHRVISNDKVFVAWNRWLIQKGCYFYAFSHIPQHELRLPDRTFTITCLRDPAERVISHYKMLEEFRRENIPHPCMKTEGRWLGSSFDDFLERIPKEHLLNQLYMFSKKFDVNEAQDNILKCSHFFFTERFSQGISHLSSKIGIQLKPVRLRTSTIDFDVNEKETNRLRMRLEDEYKLMELLNRNNKNNT